MRIVLDAYRMGTGITGTDRQAQNVIRELQLLDSTNEFLIIVNANDEAMTSLLQAPNFHSLPVSFKMRTLWTLISLPVLLHRERADVFFSFHNLTAPGIKVCRTIVSALDLIPFLYPASFHVRSRWKKWLILNSMRRSARMADALLANSHYTRDQTATFFKLPLQQFAVGDLQADPKFSELPTLQHIHEVQQRYSLPPTYVFTLGSSEPRKNVARLVSAHRNLPTALRQQYPLIIGGPKWHDARLDVNDNLIISTGFIADEDLPIVYHQAAAFAFPSEYEGFGLPLLEAMAAGVPVLTSTATALPEIAGNAAILVDPKDELAMTAGLDAILTNTQLRTQLCLAGKHRLQEYSWRNNATTLLQLLTMPVKRP